MIFYTHVKHSPTEAVYIKYYKKYIKNALQTHTYTHACARAHTHTDACAHTHTYTDCSRNWLLILVITSIGRFSSERVKGFKFGTFIGGFPVISWQSKG